MHGLDLDLDVVPPAVTDEAGDTLLADHIARDAPDFVGLSLYLWNVERSLHLAREIKRRSPGTRILVGGPEVSPDNPFVLAQGGFDLAVTGEAEDTFAALMHRLLDGGDPAGLPGVAARRGDGTLGPFGPPPTANFPLTDYPSPYLDGSVPVEARRSTYVETVRGCRSHCTYCFYPRSSGGTLRVLDVQQSAALVAALREAGARQVTFLDPTFNHRPELEAVVDALAAINHDRALSFFAEIRAEGMKPHHAKALARAGFDKLEIGLQSVNQQTLKRIRRGGRPDQVVEVAKMLAGEGVELLIDLIVGLPGDTADDVARGVELLLAHDLGEFAQVFPLSLLPGTAMRTTARADGVEFDPSPPYRVRRTATMDEETLLAAFFAAEEALDRRLDEFPRPHLVAAGGEPADVLTVDLDHATGEALARAAAPGASHVALWLAGRDLFSRRDVLLRALDARLAVDPYATLDVVLCPERPFPLDLLDLVRARLAAATPSYFSRAIAHRGEDLQRRLVVVLPRDAAWDPDYLEALMDEVPVYRDQSVAEALEAPAELGDTRPRARILTPELDRADWQALRAEADPEAVSFADRRLERAWVELALGYADG